MNEPTTRYGLIRRRIRSRAEAHQFLRDLFDMGLLSHPEDSPDSVTDPLGDYLFTQDESDLLAQRIGEVYDFDQDPCAFCLTLNTSLERADDPDPDPEPEPEPESKLELAILQLSILCTDLEKGMSKSIQRLVARSTREVLVELKK